MTVTASRMVICVLPDCVTQNEVAAKHVFEMPTVRRTIVCFSNALKAKMAHCATLTTIATVADATSRNLLAGPNLAGMKLASRMVIVNQVTVCCTNASMGVMVIYATLTTIATVTDATWRNLLAGPNLAGMKLASRMLIVNLVTVCFTNVSTDVTVTYATPMMIATRAAAAGFGVHLGGERATCVQLTMIANPEIVPGGSHATDQSERRECH